MAIELRLAKSDAATPWGFRLTGGANLEIPLTTIKVVEDGIAKSCGLQVGDVIIRINDEDIAGLSHGQAHDRIVQSGNELYFTVVRTGLSEVLKSLIQEEEDKQNEEISNFMTGTVPIDYPEKTIEDLLQDEENQSKIPQHDLNLTDEEIHSIINPEIVTKKEKSNNKPIANPELKEIRQPQNNEIEKPPITQEEVKFMQSEVIKEINNAMKQATEAERRWSTFLQKPKRPVPVTAPKFQVQKSTYKVKIRTKKDLEIERAAKQAKLEAEALIAQVTEAAEKTELKIAEEAEIEKSDDDFVSSDSDFSFSDSENSTESTITFTPSDTEPTISFTESLNSLEGKLEQVKEQLQIYNVELVPDHLQKILTKIANKLEKIVKVVKPVTKDMPQQNGDATDDDVDYDELDFSDDESSIESISINSSISTQTSSSTPSYQGTEPTLTFSSYSIMSDEPSAMTPEGTEPTISFSDEHADVAECDRTEFDVTEMQDYQENEEIIQQVKEEKTSKKDKDRNKMDPDGPQVPLVRPIILPGGRKWGAPDDAIRSATRRHASLTDERIDQTISSYYEKIDGKTVGINFLKYQPPPKNLDHLKNSEVFKMVHNMDAEQLAGIFSRPEKVLSEQDYHVNNVNQTPSPLPR